MVFTFVRYCLTKRESSRRDAPERCSVSTSQNDQRAQNREFDGVAAHILNDRGRDPRNEQDFDFRHDKDRERHSSEHYDGPPYRNRPYPSASEEHTQQTPR